MAPKPCVPSSGRFSIRTITTVTVQNLHDSDDLAIKHSLDVGLLGYLQRIVDLDA